MYKIIACDLDETLLNDDRKITQKNKDFIQKAINKGVKFVPATGRGFETVQNTLKDLNLHDLDGAYVISFNGGAITENKNNRIVQFNGMTFDIINRLFKFGLNYDVCIHIYSIDKVYIYNNNENEQAYLKGRMDGCIDFDTPNIDFLKDDQLVKILFQSLDSDLLKKIKEDIKVITDDYVTVSFSSNRYIEFNKQNVDKGKGLISLAELLGVDIKDTIAIGDNMNDLSMIIDAGLGIAVKNAVEEVKLKSGYVCEATNNQDAVAEVIEKFILND